MRGTIRFRNRHGASILEIYLQSAAGFNGMGRTLAEVICHVLECYDWSTFGCFAARCFARLKLGPSGQIIHEMELVHLNYDWDEHAGLGFLEVEYDVCESAADGTVTICITEDLDEPGPALDPLAFREAMHIESSDIAVTIIPAADCAAGTRSEPHPDGSARLSGLLLIHEGKPVVAFALQGCGWGACLAELWRRTRNLGDSGSEGGLRWNDVFFELTAGDCAGQLALFLSMSGAGTVSVVSPADLVADVLDLSLSIVLDDAGSEECSEGGLQFHVRAIRADGQSGTPRQLNFSLALPCSTCQLQTQLAAFELFCQPPWSVCTHQLFPTFVREYAVQLLLLGSALGRCSAFWCDSLMDCWVAEVMPRVIAHMVQCEVVRPAVEGLCLSDRPSVL